MQITYFPSNQVTYDNSSSKVKFLHNVQGAIDELYNTCKDATSTSSGKNIYYYRDYRIYKIDVNTGTSSVISELNSKPDFLTSSGNNVYYGRNPYVNFNKYAIYKLNVSTGTSSMISELNSTPDFWVAVLIVI